MRWSRDAICLGDISSYEAKGALMSTDRIDTSICDDLQDLVDDGRVISKVLDNVGLDPDHPHHIIFIKIDPTLGDPCALLKAKLGSKCFLIRPNDVEPSPSNERNPVSGNNQLYNWYLMSCPHDPPCPLLLE